MIEPIVKEDKFLVLVIWTKLKIREQYIYLLKRVVSMTSLWSEIKSGDTLVLILFLIGIILKPFPPIYLIIAFFVIAYFSLRSWKSAWILVVAGMIFGFLFEFLGTHTGIPVGWYYYDRLGLQYAGVSLYVPVMWGIYTFEAYFFARQVTKGWRASLLTAILLVILDLALDPIMTSWNAWVWVTKTEINWFGIPWTNYVGWFVSSMSIVLVYIAVVRFLRGNKEDYAPKIRLEFTSAPYLFELLTFFVYTLTSRVNLAVLCALILAIAVVTLVIVQYKTIGTKK